MSQTSIFEKAWLDLVFEGKNKAYGAYKLRQENGRTTIKAFLFGIASLAIFVGVLSQVGTASAATPESPVLPPSVIIPVTFDPPAVEPKGTEKPPVRTETTEEVATSKDLINPEVVTKDQNPDEITTNEELKKPDPQPEGSENGVAMTNPLPGGGGAGGEGEGTAGGSETGSSVDLNSPMIPATLDRQPMFPGGIQKFYGQVRDKFHTPNVESMSGSVKILVSFVVERDGRMTEIKTLNHPGYELEREAIRVLKSMKTKWEPGIYKGQPVRALYTLPIAVKIN